MRPYSKRLLLAVSGALWAAGVAAVLLSAGRYRATPGPVADAPGQWPSELPFAPIAGQITVVMLAHPRCPCTRASLSELDRLMAEVGNRASAYILFVRPPGTSPGWEETDTWASAHRIPRTTVRVDADGADAARLGALTSGQVVAYDEHGRLRFSGGITGGRGHAGDNPGHAELRRLILDGPVEAAASTPVFGCPLGDPAPSRGGGA